MKKSLVILLLLIACVAGLASIRWFAGPSHITNPKRIEICSSQNAQNGSGKAHGSVQASNRHQTGLFVTNFDLNVPGKTGFEVDGSNFDYTITVNGLPPYASLMVFVNKKLLEPKVDYTQDGHVTGLDDEPTHTCKIFLPVKTMQTAQRAPPAPYVREDSPPLKPK
jgi:hypothetical protein